MRPLRALPFVVAIAAASVALGCDASPHYGPYEPYVFDAAQDVTAVRLCEHADDPDADADPLHPACRLEGEDLAAPVVDVPDALHVFAYNVERGYELDGQLAWLAGPDAPRPDVVVLTEADRGCARTGRRHVAREWAEALGMDYVYAVEFEEVEFDANGAVADVCEHGNAVLTRLPMGNVAQIRFAVTDDWNTRPELRTYPTGTRFGGRVALRVDLDLGRRRLRFYGAHLASGALDDDQRHAEIDELLADAADVTYPMMIAGDLNTHFYRFDALRSSESVTRTLLEQGWVDSHASLPFYERTTDLEYGLVIDLIFGQNGVTFSDPWIGPADTLGTLSDHLPVAATAHF